MKKFILFTVLSLCTTKLIGQATVPFTCNDGFGYLFQGGPADVFQIDLQTGVSTKVKESIMPSGAVSAGYNPVDNFIWVVNKTTQELAKVDANWNITTYASNLPRNIHVADVDKNGIFYAYTGTSIYRYDLNTPIPTQLSTLTTNNISVSDFAFNPIDGFIYGVANNGRIFKTNPANGSTTIVRSIDGLPNQTYGAVYFDGNGTLYVNGNSNGQIYKISNAALSNPASTEDAVFFSNGPSASSNDGARCASAPLCKVGTTTPNLSQASAVNTCSSNSINLANISASNTPDGTILTWHTGTPTVDGNRITNLTVTTAGTYYATFYDAQNTCYSASSQPFVVTINPTPTTPTGISVNNNTVCIGESVNLSGTCAVGIINWYVNSTNGTFVGTGSPRSVSPTATTNYVATCKTTNPNCESAASNSVTVTVNPKPSAPNIVAGSTRICRGTSTTLTALGCSGTVNWSPGGASGATITVSPTDPTTYSATCTNAAGCVSDASNSTVDITIASIFFYVDRTNVCSGENVTLTMGGCTASREFYANGNLLSSSMSDTYVNNPTTNVTYTAKCGGVDVTACATNSTAGVSITVRTTPAPPTLSGGTTICAGSSTTLIATGCTGTVNWSNSQTGNSISVSPSTTTAYTATCLLDGCLSTNSSPVSVVVENIPSTPTGLSDATICQGTSVNLGGSCATGNVIWYSNSNLSTTVAMPISPTNSGNYYAVCATANCASSSVTVPVVVNPTPNAPTGARANPSTICSGASTVLSGNCSGGSSIAFFSNAALSTRLASSTVSPSSTTTYYVACELAGCKSTGATISVTVNASPSAPTGLTSSTTICQGTSTTLNGTCPGGSTIQWYQGVVDASSLVGINTALSVSPNETTIYVATCKSNANSCESMQSNNINISVADTPATPTNFAVSSVAICSGTAVTLTGNCASGTLQFFTNAGLTASVSSPHMPASTTTYYASCVIGVCKSDAVNKTVNVTITPAAPTAVSASKTTVCLNEETILSATCELGTEVKWYTDAALTTETSATVNPTTNTIYYVACVNGECKSLTGNIAISVTPTPPNPTAVSSSPNEICKNETYSLLASCSSGSIVWFSDAALSTSINPANRTATSPETFYVACQTNGCSGTSVAFTTTVNELPPPPDIFPTDRELCLGGSLNLSASGCTGTVNWTINGTAGPNTTTISQSPTVTTVYTATCTNTASGCISPVSASTTITVVSPPVSPSITSSDTEVCAGRSFTLTSINCSGTINWFETGNATTIGSANPITITPTATKSYFATCTTAGTVVQCESGNSDPISVTYKTIPSAPSISATSNSICNGESTNLNATDCSGEVIWSDGSMGNSVSVTPTENTTYTANCVENGCSSVSSTGLAITVNPIPAAPTSLTADVICSGQSSNLNGTCLSGSTIQWYTDENLTTTTTAAVSPISSTTYYATCQLNGCKSTSESVVVNVTTTPTAPSVSASETTICNGASSELTGSCTSGDIKWYSDAALTNELSSTIVSPATTTTYFAACVNGTCKSLASQQEITVNQLPTSPTLSTGSTTVCSTSSFDITASGCTGMVNWSNGQSGNTITVSLTADQTFTATCTDANGCVSPESTPLAITVVPIPDLPQISPSNSEICPGGTITLTATGCSGTLSWFESNAPATSIGSNPTLDVTPTVSSSYFVTCIVSSAGCSSGESEAAAITIKALPTITEIVPLTCTDASNAMYAFQTSGGSASNVAVTNGLTASFDTDGRDGAVAPDTRQVWVIENIPSNQAFTVNVTENGCITSTNFTAPDCGTATPFPVDLLWFKGDIADEKIMLNWLTANETGIQQFEVEKSRDAVNFYKIGTIAAKNSAEKQLYSFDDANPLLGVNYYRLRIKEFDLEDSFSNIIALDFSKRTEFQWKLFPNPFDAELNYISIETNGKAMIKSIDFYNINGVRLQTELETISTNNYRLQIGRIPVNTYLIRIYTDAGFFTKKLIVNK